MGTVLTYSGALDQAMQCCARHPRVIAIGQSIVYGGQRASASFRHFPRSRRIEFPVCEDLQMGFSIGLAMGGFIPLSFYPRMDFLLCAMSQLVLHLNCWQKMGGDRLHLIIRTAVGSKSPLDAGPQHTGNYSAALSLMLGSVHVRHLNFAEQIVPAYRTALENPGVYLIVEYMDQYPS